MRMISPSSGRLFIVLITLVVGACSSRQATYAPDGRRGYVVTCGGYLNSFANCLVKAGRACGNKGYETLKGGEDDRSLLVACKVPR